MEVASDKAGASAAQPSPVLPPPLSLCHVPGPGSLFSKAVFLILTLKEIKVEVGVVSGAGDILLSIALKITALLLYLNLANFQITKGAHCTLFSAGPDFVDFVTWKHLVRASQLKSKLQPPPLFWGLGWGRGWREKENSHNCCPHECLSGYKVWSLRKLLT